MSRAINDSGAGNIDWITLILYIVMVLFGWMNIHAASYNPDQPSLFSLDGFGGKQLMFIVIAGVIAVLIMYMEGSVFSQFGWLVYVICIGMLLLVLVVGSEKKGAQAWIQIGSFTLQPSEFAKMGTALLLARFVSTTKAKFKTWRTRIIAAAIIGLPAGLVLLQPDVGSVLVFVGFIFAMYREGLSGNILIVGVALIALAVVSIIAGATSVHYPFMGDTNHSGVYIILIILTILSVLTLVFIRNFVVPRARKVAYIVTLISWFAGSSFCLSIDIIMADVLQPHQRERILVLFGLEERAMAIGQEEAKETASDTGGQQKKRDPGYNARMAKITVGSGGFFGHGFMEGPMTRNHYVPEQWTDFIFSAVAEEWGFVGSLLVLGMFVYLIIRLIGMAERQRSHFSRVYGYCVVSILFMHLLINVGMVIGLAPIIGIPLPFFSYGGSSLLAFTILLFIFLRLDAERLAVFR
jgi:rod shape determining protein RodA